jgi:general stress protein YciG
MAEQEAAKKRGLASASNETRERVAKAGGEAPHEKRGLQAADTDTRQAVARKGGLARGEQRRKARQDRETPQDENPSEVANSS